MTNQILVELKKFNNPKTIHQVKSFVIFNLSSSNKYKLLKHIQDEFLLVSNSLKKKRATELKEMEEDDSEMKEIRNRYRELHKRVTDIQIISEITECENDAVLNIKEHIDNKDTCLKDLVTLFTFEDINFEEILLKERDLDELHQKWDFLHLANTDQGKLFANHDKLSETDKCYMEVKEYLHRKRFSKYRFYYNASHQPIDNDVIDKLLNEEYRWQGLKWTIFGFGISKQEFERNVSESIKRKMYFNRILLEQFIP